MFSQDVTPLPQLTEEGKSTVFKNFYQINVWKKQL